MAFRGHAGTDSVEDIFCQNFTAGVPGIGESLTVPLKDDGEDIMVTEENRREFVDLYVDYYLNAAIHKQVSHHLWYCQLSHPGIHTMYKQDSVFPVELRTAGIHLQLC